MMKNGKPRMNLEKRMLAAYLRNDGRKAAGEGTSYDQGKEYGERCAKEPLTVPFTMLDDFAGITKKAGGEIGKLQGERVADWKTNYNAVLGGKASAEARATELQTAPVFDSLKLGMDFGFGYFFSAGETLVDTYAQNCDSFIIAANDRIEAASKMLGIPAVMIQTIPTFVNYRGEFEGLVDSAGADEKVVEKLLAFYDGAGKKEIRKTVPGVDRFVKFLRENAGK
jgi:hypothetical protein